ncbi:TetR/AcrR family transcriptional regulator [Streptomyces lonarensis]|uniref:TetR family transcriptional regulator n=1 Tax=Streptomyces lonarensis TaxID=700599 RepID=A0A7X6D337_9ACTN|nr:TetR/AcrR family transcriptional regulator [Streptomyces lonarensis]NJQ07284.1 TetR family transcriptional regulator [Streptomyces lonarensis]
MQSSIDSPSHRSPTRLRLLDAAVTVIARDGLQRLSHRRVEDEAGLKHGATTYHFRTRDALIEQVIAHLADRDRQVMGEVLGGAPHPEAPDELARVLRPFLTSARDQTMARFELFLHAAREPALQGHLARWRRLFSESGEALLRHLGAPDPAGAAEMLVTGIDGMLFAGVCLPDRLPPAELRRQCAALLDRCMAAPGG